VGHLYIVRDDLVLTPYLGLWYPKGAHFELIGYSDADYTGCKVDSKSTSRTCQYLGRSLVLIFHEIKFCCPIHGWSWVCFSWELLCTTSLDATNSKGLWLYYKPSPSSMWQWVQSRLVIILVSILEPNTSIFSTTFWETMPSREM
jgi:hypothetical protein